MPNYKTLLEHSFKQTQEDQCSEPGSRLAYLADHIFDFTTYDDSMGALFATKAIEVCLSITNRTTFEYIKTPENYQWYLLMCNIPFFSSRIDWGTSIRGAFWKYEEITLSSCGLYSGYDQISTPIAFTNDEWNEFIKAIAEFAAPEMAATIQPVTY